MTTEPQSKTVHDNVNRFDFIIEKISDKKGLPLSTLTFIRLPETTSANEHDAFAEKSTLPPLPDGTYFLSRDFPNNIDHHFRKGLRTLRENGFIVGDDVKNEIIAFIDGTQEKVGSQTR